MSTHEPITLKEVQLRVGVPQHVLIHLCEKGVIEPDFAETSGRGKRREFSRTNLFEFGVALALRRLELPVATVAALNDAVLKPDILELVYERTAKKIREQFAHVPEELRLKRIELNRAETRVHNFVEFIASGRATPALGDALAQAEEQVKSLTADVASMESAKGHAFTPPHVPGSWRCDGIARRVRAYERGRDGPGEGARASGGGEAVGLGGADHRRAAEAWERSAGDVCAVHAHKALRAVLKSADAVCGISTRG